MGAERGRTKAESGRQDRANRSADRARARQRARNEFANVARCAATLTLYLWVHIIISYKYFAVPAAG